MMYCYFNFVCHWGFFCMGFKMYLLCIL